MSQRNLLLIGLAALAYIYLRPRARAASPTSAIAPVVNGSLPGAVGLLQPVAGGGYLFPELPMNQAFTTDPATGQVYIVENPVPALPGYVSVADQLRGRP